MDSFVLVAHGSFPASRTLLQWLLACLNFTLDSEDLFCCYKWKKMISMSYCSSCCWKPWSWVSFELILTMRDICINSNLDSLTKFTSSSGNTQFKDILPWNISEMITKTIPISSRIVNLCNEMKCPVLSLLESHQKLRQHIRIFQWTEPHCRINT